MKKKEVRVEEREGLGDERADTKGEEREKTGFAKDSGGRVAVSARPVSCLSEARTGSCGAR